MRSKSIAASCVIAIAVIAIAHSARAADDPYTLMTSTADAISTVMSKWRTGEMELEYDSTIHGLDSGTNLAYKQTVAMSGRVVWVDGSRYSDYHFLDNVTHPSSAKLRVVASPLNGQTEVIKTSKFHCLYVAQGQTCIYQTTNLDQLDQMRYHAAFDPRASWCNLMPPYPMTGHIQSLTWRSETEKTTVIPVKSSPRRHQILRDDGNGFVMGFVVDLDHGGMIVEAWAHPPLVAKNNWIAATWEWAQDPHSVWYVSKWTNMEYAPKNREDIVFQQEARIKNFNSQPRIPANRFDFSSLKLAKGTRVSKVTKQGTTYSYVGGPPPKKGIDLDGLIDDAKAGFAAPPEDKKE